MKDIDYVCPIKHRKSTGNFLEGNTEESNTDNISFLLKRFWSLTALASLECYSRHRINTEGCFQPSALPQEAHTGDAGPKPKEAEML